MTSSLSSDSRYLHSEVDKDHIPQRLSQLVIDRAKKKWKYARCFDKMLPRENPSNADAVNFYTILLKVHEFSSNTISKCLLKNYKKLCLSCYLSYSKAKAGDIIKKFKIV